MTTNKKKSVGAFFGNLLHNNRFLAILSIILALFVWIYILYVLNPVNEKKFDDIPVDVLSAFEGSTLDDRGYMMLESAQDKIDVTVSGTRAALLNFSEEDLKISLDMNSILSAGERSVKVIVTSNNSNIKVTDYYPTEINIKFAVEATREIPVEILQVGALPEGYEIDEQTVSPQNITVTGPADTVAEIDKAYVKISLDNVKENFSGTYDISLVHFETGSGNKTEETNVERRYLDISATSAEASVAVAYRKTLAAAVEIVNTYGGNNETSLVSVAFDTTSVKATGPEKVLSGMNEILLGTIDTALFEKSGTVTLEVPPLEGVTYDTQQITATVTVAKDLTVKTLTFDTASITCKNVPTGKVARVNAGKIYVRIRGSAAALKDLKADQFKCEADVSKANEDGSYPIFVTPTATVSGITFDVVGAPSVKVNFQ